MRFSYVAVFACGLALAAAQSGGKPEPSLQKAIQTEMVDGDLKSAIEQYKAIAEGRDRGLAAKALVRLGECYEKLRDPQAKKVYERVVAQYADQPEAVQARARLAAKAVATEPVAAPSRTLVWDHAVNMAGVLWFTGAAPDGSFIVYSGNGGSGLWRHDFSGGDDHIISAGGAPWCPRVSPDGKFVAYFGPSPDKSGSALRVVGVDGAGMRALVKSETIVAPLAWSPDGARLLVSRGNDLGFVSVADGSITLVRSGGKDISAMPNAFSPDGRYIVFHDVDPKDTKPDKPRYVIWIMDAGGGGSTQILSDPGAGSVQPMWAPDGRSILFRSTRSGEQSLWSVAMADGKAQGSPLLVGQDDTWPVALTQDGSAFYATWSSENDIYVASIDPATLKATSSPQRLNQRYVGGVSGSFAWSPDGRSVVYVAKGAILVHSMDTNEERAIIPPGDRPAMRLRYSPDGQWLLAATLIDQRKDLHFSRIDVQTGNETALFDLKDVFSADLSADGKTVYYSPRIVPVPVGKDGTAVVRIVRRNLQSGEETEVVRLNSKRNTELGLSPDGRQIVFLYCGADDQPLLMSVSSEGGAIRRLTQNFGAQVAWTADSQHLLTAMGGRGSAQIYSIPAEGGEPQPLGISGSISSFAASPKNDVIAFNRTEDRRQIWLYKNLLPPAPAQ